MQVDVLMECLEPPAIAGGSDQSQNTGQLYADQCFDNMARVTPPPPTLLMSQTCGNLKVYAQTKRDNAWVYFSVIILSTFKENMSV